MKNILTVWMIIFPFSLFAQVGMKNMSLKHPDSALLYIGVPNTIEIFGLKDFRNLEIKMQQGTVPLSANRKFTVIVNNEGADTLRLYQNKKLLSTKVFNLKHLGDIERGVGDFKKSSGFATVYQVLSNGELWCGFTSSIYIHNPQIKKFDLTICNPPFKLKSCKVFKANKGPLLTSRQIKKIKELKPGSKLFFENIKIIDFDGLQRTLATMIITIK